MGKKNRFGRGPKADKSQQLGNKGGKPTHFLCFPIASDTTVPLISESLKQWRAVTSTPQKRPLIRVATSEGASASNDFDAPRSVKNEEPSNIQRPTSTLFVESLKILPPVVTRAAGTWHLTLGVMNLEEGSRIEKALKVLHGLDLQRLLRDAEKGPPEGYKPARKWKDEERDTKESAGQSQQPLQPITIALTGIGGFPSLGKARVLWARPRAQISPVDSAAHPIFGGSQRLYNFALHLIQPFRDAELITETRALALHATVANMRFAKSQGKIPTWKSQQVDARKIGKVWNEYSGDLLAAVDSGIGDEETDSGTMHQEANSRHESDGEDEEENIVDDSSKEFIWLKNVIVNRVAICKLGASNHDDPLWGQWYPAIEDGERLIFTSGD